MTLHVEPPNISPTWRNNRLGEEAVSKNIDRFLVNEFFIADADNIRSWVGTRGGLGHSLILLQMEKMIKSHPCLSNSIPFSLLIYNYGNLQKYHK